MLTVGFSDTSQFMVSESFGFRKLRKLGSFCETLCVISGASASVSCVAGITKSSISDERIPRPLVSLVGMFLFFLLFSYVYRRGAKTVISFSIFTFSPCFRSTNRTFHGLLPEGYFHLAWVACCPLIIWGSAYHIRCLSFLLQGSVPDCVSRMPY